MRWILVRSIVGLAVFAVAQFTLARLIQDSIPWGIEQAKPVTEPRPENEHAFVVVTGSIESVESADDPEYVLPGKYLYLERFIEILRKDDDDDLEWVWTESAGSIGPHWSRVGEATIGGFRFRMDRASFSEVPEVHVDEALLRVDSRPPGKAYARWLPSQKRLVAGPDVIPGDDWLEATVDGSEHVRAVLSFRGFEKGTTLAVAGIQENGTIVPLAIFPGDAPTIPIARSATTMQREHTKSVEWGFALVLAAALGFLFVFLHPSIVGFWLSTAGIGAIVVAFMHGVRQGFAMIAVTAVPFGSLFVTHAIAKATPSAAAVLGWIGGVVIVSAVVRALVGKTEGDESVD